MKPARAFRFAAVLLAVAIQGPSAQARSITLSNEVAKFSDGVAARKLMVGPIGGRGGDDLAIALERALTAVKVRGQPYFSALPAPPGAGAPAVAARRVGADAALLATVSVDSQEGALEGLDFACVARKPDGGCARTALVKRVCIRRNVRATAVVQVVRATSGQVVYSTSKAQDRGVTWCSGPAPRSVDSLVSDAAGPLARTIAQDLAPSIQKVELTIKDDDKTLPKEPRANLRAAARLADKNLDAACASWRALDATVPRNPAITFNLGVCAEVAGDATGALARYRDVTPLLPPGDVDLAAATSRVQLTIARQEEAARVERERRAAEAAEASRQAQRSAEARRAEAADRRRAADRAARTKAEADAKQAGLRAKYGKAADAISRGQVVKGMTQGQVIAAKGQPQRRERLGPGDEQWYYPGQRVIFTGGKVTYIGS